MGNKYVCASVSPAVAPSIICSLCFLISPATGWSQTPKRGFCSFQLTQLDCLHSRSRAGGGLTSNLRVCLATHPQGRNVAKPRGLTGCRRACLSCWPAGPAQHPRMESERVYRSHRDVPGAKAQQTSSHRVGSGRGGGGARNYRSGFLQGLTSHSDLTSGTWHPSSNPQVGLWLRTQPDLPRPSIPYLSFSDFFI